MGHNNDPRTDWVLIRVWFILGLVNFGLDFNFKLECFCFSGFDSQSKRAPEL